MAKLYGSAHAIEYIINFIDLCSGNHTIVHSIKLMDLSVYQGYKLTFLRGT